MPTANWTINKRSDVATEVGTGIAVCWRGGRKGPRSPPEVAVGSTPVSSSGTATTPRTLHKLAVQPPRAEISVIPGFGNPFSLRAASGQPFHRVSLTAAPTCRAYTQSISLLSLLVPPAVNTAPPLRSSGNLTHCRNTTLIIVLFGCSLL